MAKALCEQAKCNRVQVASCDEHLYEQIKTAGQGNLPPTEPTVIVVALELVGDSLKNNCFHKSAWMLSIAFGNFPIEVQTGWYLLGKHWWWWIFWLSTAGPFRPLHHSTWPNETMWLRVIPSFSVMVIETPPKDGRLQRPRVCPSQCTYAWSM